MSKLKAFPVIDGHCDTLTKMLYQNQGIQKVDGHINLDKLRKGGVLCQVFAIWIDRKQVSRSPLKYALKSIDLYHKMLKENSNYLRRVKNFNDIKNLAEDSIGTILAIEGGDAIEGELANLRILYLLGVRLMTLTWNYRNEICDGILEKNSASGLSNFGISLIKEMNRLNMIIDISHISTKGFWDVLEHSKFPIIASHSNARKICPHPRNLCDDQIRAISRCKGIIGINFYEPFLSTHRSNLDDIIRHIEHIAALGGIDVLGFGSDFDGMDKLPQSIQGPQDYSKIINRLLQLNYSENDIRGITSENYIRVIKSVLG